MKNKLSEETINLIRSNVLELDIGYSYSKLTEALHLPKLTGNSKTSQLAELARYIKWEKIKTDYYIEEIYPDPLPPTRKQKDLKYDDYIRILLMNYLLSCEGNTAVFTRKGWWRRLNMVNSNYLALTSQTAALPEGTDLSGVLPVGNPPASLIKHDLQAFYHNSYAQFSKIFERALQRLERQSFIKYSSTFFIKEFNQSRIATTDEIEIILEARRKVLARFGLDNMGVVSLQPQSVQRRFYGACAKLLHDEYCLSRDSDVQVYDCIQIIFTKEGMEAQIGREVARCGRTLNELCVAWALNWGAVSGGVNEKLIKICTNTYIALDFEGRGVYYGT